MCKILHDFVSRLSSNPLMTFVAGIAAGVITSVILVLFLPYLQAEPDFFITVDYPYTHLDNKTDMISVFVHDVNKKYFKEYKYPIALFLREEGANSLPEGITVDPEEQILDLVDSIDSRIKKNITLDVKSTTGPHLIEILAIGGDGKVRSTHLVIDSDQKTIGEE